MNVIVVAGLSQGVGPDLLLLRSPEGCTCPSPTGERVEVLPLLEGAGEGKEKPQTFKSLSTKRKYSQYCFIGNM